MYKKYITHALLSVLLVTFISSCKNQTTEGKTIVEKIEDVVVPEPEEKAPEINYSFISKADWVGQGDSFEGSKHLDILTAINRVDSAHIKRLDSILIPDRYDLELNDYLPFPKQVDLLKDVNKIIIFSNPVQAFAAYEKGELVIQGPTNMGKKSSPTPPNLYSCNWKAKRSVSTVDKTWILNWNFNISNLGGIGFHQYALPGYPASHSCIRLLNHHAFFLYNWAEQWIVKNDILVAHGTPVIVYSTYPFGGPRPWHALVGNPQAMSYNQDSMKKIIEPYLDKILERQNQRAAHVQAKAAPAL